MERSEEEVKAYIENIVPEFREHKQRIIQAYGKYRVDKALNQRVEVIRRAHEDIRIGCPDVKVEEVVNVFNDTVDRKCIAKHVDAVDNLYNKQLNIIAGMIIRGYDI